MQKFKVLLLIIFQQLIANTLFAQAAFVKVREHQFILNEKPLYFIGTNYWYGGLLALQKDPLRGKERVKKELDFLRSNGVTNLRVLVGSEGMGMVNGVPRVSPPLQPTKGKFDDTVLESLDFLLSELGKRQMFVVLYLSNNWEWSGGFLQYLNWNKQLSDEDIQNKMSWDEVRDQTAKFYSCAPCLKDYEEQVKHILYHFNKYTRRNYINEPAIMAWEIANEPRPMRPAAASDYKIFIYSTTSLIKTLDKNHLITIGAEGSMGTETLELFRDVHALKTVDYLTIHIWPKNWGWFKNSRITDSLDRIIKRSIDYIHEHRKVADQLRKPLVIEEFGLPRDDHSFSIDATTTCRDRYYSAVFEELIKSQKNNSSIGGVNFWGFGGFARPVAGQLYWKTGDDFSGDPPQEEQGLNSVFIGDRSTWKIVRAFSQKTNTKHP